MNPGKPVAGEALRYRLFASCVRYLEAILLEELKELGAEEAVERRAGVSFRGDLETAYRVCLYSRTASRVFLQLAEGRANTEAELYDTAANVPWSEHFSLQKKFSVSVHAVKSSIRNESFAARKIKDAVADSFRRQSGERPSVDSVRPDIRIHGMIEGPALILSLDLSGESLHRRGYRTEKTEAPLRETSAAAMLLKAGWPAILKEGGTLIDPMCGSGTLAVEAALMLSDTAPGLLRPRFGFESWKGHDELLWKGLKEEAKEKSLRRNKEGDGDRRPQPAVYASDIAPKAVEICRRNLRRAGMEAFVEVKCGDFRDIPVEEVRGSATLIATNPPYGVRISEEDEVRELYSDFGRWMSEKFSGCRAAVLTGGKEAAKYIGLRAQRVVNFYNGRIEGALALFSLSEDNRFREYIPKAEKNKRQPRRSGLQSPSARPSENENDQSRGVNEVLNRIEKNRRRLKKYLQKEGISCYRIYDADIPQYAAAIDVYEDRYFVVQEYAAPKTVDPQRAESRLKEIEEAVAAAFGADRRHIYVKQRKRQRGGEQYHRYDRRGERYIVNEGGLRFFVNFTDYLDTGLFLDHRSTRGMLRRLSRGKKMLNLFAYTCSAGIYAAAGGAAAVDSVDTATTYLEWGKLNFRLNGFEQGVDAGSYTFIRRDAMDFLRDAGSYGLIFIDPPTFSNRKGAERDFDVQRDHPELLRRAYELLEPGGTVIFSNNYRDFVLDEQLRVSCGLRELSGETIPEDFLRNRKIHRAWIGEKPDTTS